MSKTSTNGKSSSLGRELYMEEVRPGLWRVLIPYRDNDGLKHIHREVIGNKTQTKNQRDEYLDQLERGTFAAGKFVRPQAPLTFREVYEEYEATVGKGMRGWKSSYRPSLNLFKKAWSSRLLKSITKEDISKWKYARVTQQYKVREGVYRTIKKSTITTNLVALSALFSWAKELGYVNSNPVRDVKKFSTIDSRRKRQLSQSEEIALWNAFDCAPRWLQDVVAIALLTGMRVSEICSMRWSDIDWALGTAALQSERSKNREADFVQLNQACRDILRRIQTDSGLATVWVFPSRGKVGHISESGHLTRGSVSKQWQKVREVAGIEDVQFRDLRRTFVSRLTQRKENLRTIQVLVRHKHISTTQRYSYLYREDLAEVVEGVQLARPQSTNGPATTPR